MDTDAMKTDLQKPTCVRTFAGKPNKSQHLKTSKLSKAAQLWQHSHHHSTLFAKVGAGGRGRNP